MYSPEYVDSVKNVNVEDPFIRQREIEFTLSSVIPQYDKVIEAIEAYKQCHAGYPQTLEDLVPEYLDKVPEIYIRKGEELKYEPEPFEVKSVPFTFYITGHYPGLSAMHGWKLMYCPVEFASCNTGGDRHFSEFRVNDVWIWINESAL